MLQTTIYGEHSVYSCLGIIGLPLLASLLLNACASAPQLMDQQAKQLGLLRLEISGTDYQHVIYRNASSGNTLHVYLAGDGTPWFGRYHIAADPTPRRPLTLQLMARDPAPSILLGRPCYHGFAHYPPCTPALWTTRRYGPEIVDSMAAALFTYLGRNPYQNIVFIGYSGGGALAMLLAERFPETRALLTIAGNLDPAAWAAWHGYSPLLDSLNPAERPPLPATITQLHIIGGRDKNIPGHLIRAAVARQPNAKLIVRATFDHSCCWLDDWLAILSELDKKMANNK